MLKKLIRAIGNCHSHLHGWYWFSKGSNGERTAGGKWLLSLNTPCKPALPCLYWKFMVLGGVGDKTQILKCSEQFSSPGPDLDLQGLLPISGIGLYYVFLFVGLICRRPAWNKLNLLGTELEIMLLHNEGHFWWTSGKLVVKLQSFQGLSMNSSCNSKLVFH